MVRCVLVINLVHASVNYTFNHPGSDPTHWRFVLPLSSKQSVPQILVIPVLNLFNRSRAGPTTTPSRSVTLGCSSMRVKSVTDQ